MEFNDRRGHGVAIPKDKSGNTVYPHSPAKTNFDSAQQLDVESSEHLSRILKRKSGSRYDENSGTFKAAKIDRWHHYASGSLVPTTYPAGYSGEVR